MSGVDKLLKALFQIQEFKIRNDDDFLDRMNRQYTPCILCLFTVLVSVKQYVGDPINCWCPAQFTSSHQEYTNTVCWVSDTYYVPFERDMPKIEEPRQMISYYQWVPLILLCQSALFFFPYIVWRFLNRRAGVNLGSVIEAGMTCQRAVYNDAKEKTMRYMVSQVDGYLLTTRSYSKGFWPRVKSVMAQHCCLFCGKLYGNYLVFTYLFVKLLYIGNAVGQLFLLDVFLGFHRDYHLYGINLLKGMIEGSDWTSSDRFPRVTLCDFEIRQQMRPTKKGVRGGLSTQVSGQVSARVQGPQGRTRIDNPQSAPFATNVHRYTVQCVLPINLFNEKIFVFLWFWLLLMAIATTLNFFHWCSKCLILPLQLAYIKRQLKAIDFHKRETKTARKFTETYLRRDGVLILRLVGKNAGDLVAAELLHGLWTNYGPERRTLGDTNSDGNTIRTGNRNPIIRVPQDVV